MVADGLEADGLVAGVLVADGLEADGLEAGVLEADGLVGDGLVGDGLEVDVLVGDVFEAGDVLEADFLVADVDAARHCVAMAAVHTAAPAGEAPKWVPAGRRAAAADASTGTPGSAGAGEGTTVSRARGALVGNEWGAVAAW